MCTALDSAMKFCAESLSSWEKLSLLTSFEKTSECYSLCLLVAIILALKKKANGPTPHYFCTVNAHILPLLLIIGYAEHVADDNAVRIVPYPQWSGYCTINRSDLIQGYYIALVRYNVMSLFHFSAADSIAGQPQGSLSCCIGSSMI